MRYAEAFKVSTTGWIHKDNVFVTSELGGQAWVESPSGVFTKAVIPIRYNSYTTWQPLLQESERLLQLIGELRKYKRQIAVAATDEERTQEEALPGTAELCNLHKALPRSWVKLTAEVEERKKRVITLATSLAFITPSAYKGTLDGLIEEAKALQELL